MADEASMAGMSVEQLALIKETFAMFDKSGDGVISINELGEAMKTLGQNPTEPELQNIINDVDVDHTKTINFSEFCVLMQGQMKDIVCESEVQQAYRVFGKDEKNGFIPISELRFVLLSLGEKVSGQEVEEMLQVADTDGDGYINYEEFIPMFMPGLKKAQAEERARQEEQAKAEEAARAKQEARDAKYNKSLEMK